MPFLTDSIASALGLIFAWDPQLAVIVKLSLTVSILSTLLAAAIGGALLAVVGLVGLYFVIVFIALNLATGNGYRLADGAPTAIRPPLF